MFRIANVIPRWPAPASDPSMDISRSAARQTAGAAVSPELSAFSVLAGRWQLSADTAEKKISNRFTGILQYFVQAIALRAAMSGMPFSEAITSSIQRNLEDDERQQQMLHLQLRGKKRRWYMVPCLPLTNNPGELRKRKIFLTRQTP